MDKSKEISLFDSNLIFVTSYSYNEEPYTNDVAIAKALGFSKKYVDRKIRTHWKRLSKLGIKGIEYSLLRNNKRGQPQKIYKMNRKQAIALCNTFDDSEEVLDFKFKLADYFIDAIDELSGRKHQHEVGKQASIGFSEAIHDNPKLDDKAYLWINNLVIKLATNKTFYQVRKERNAVKGHITNEYLTVDERNRVDAVKNILLGLIKFGLGHDEIIEFVQSPIMTANLTIKQPELTK